MSAYMNIFSESKCLSRNQLQGYLHGKLDAEEIYAIESHLNDCDLCSAAIDGLMERPEEETVHELNKLKQQWVEKLAQLPKDNKKNHTPLTVRKGGRNRWMIAASAVVLIGLAGFSVYSYFNHQKGSLSKKEELNPGSSIQNKGDNEIHQIHIDTEDLKNNGEEMIKAVPANKPEAPLSQLPTETKRVDGNLPHTVNQPLQEVAYERDEDVQETKAPTNVSDDVALTLSERSKEKKITESDNQKEEVAVAKAEPIRKQTTGGLSNGYKSLERNNSPILNQSNYYGQYNNNRNDIVTNSKKKNEAYQQPPSTLQEGILLYNNGSYKKCVKKLKNALSQSSGTELEDMHYYMALAYQQMGENEKANEHFIWLKNVTRYAEFANKALIQNNDLKPGKK